MVGINRDVKVNSNDLLFHVQKNFVLYILCFICVCVGVIIGIYNVKYMSAADKGTMIQWIEGSINLYNSSNISKVAVFFTSMKNYIPIILLIWFLGLTIIGIPLVLILDVLKGYALGFTFSFIINSFGTKGLWVGMGAVLLQNLIFLPCIIIISVYSMEFSINIIRNKSQEGVFYSIFSSMLSYSLKFFVVFLFMCIGFFIEAFICPYILNLLNSAVRVIGI